MMVTGMNNGMLFRVVLPPKLLKRLVEKIDAHEEHLREGLKKFLRLDNINVESEKTFFFEKPLQYNSWDSDKVYAMLILDIVDDAAREKLTSDDTPVDPYEYEVTLPFCQTGMYMSKHYNYYNASELRHHDLIIEKLQKDTNMDFGDD